MKHQVESWERDGIFNTFAKTKTDDVTGSKKISPKMICSITPFPWEHAQNIFRNLSFFDPQLKDTYLGAV